MKPAFKPEKRTRPVPKPLSERIDIDKSIKHFINRIRLAGYETFCSCSSTVADHRPNQNRSRFSYLMIQMPKGVVRYGRRIRIRYSDFRNKDVYHQFKDIGKKSGWITIFTRRKKDWKTQFTRRNKHPTSNVTFNFWHNKRKPSDKRIHQAWTRLTKNLEKINVYERIYDEE